MGTVTIDGTSYTVYGASPLIDADAYLKGAVGKGADAWRALTEDNDKGRLIVAAFRYLESKKWDETTAGTFAVRDAIAALYAGGPTLFAQAQYELAAIFAGDPTAASASSTGSNLKRVNAKGVEVEYFRPTDTKGAGSTKMPTVVMELVGTYLASANAGAVIASYNKKGGFDECESSSFDDCAIQSRKRPF